MSDFCPNAVYVVGDNDDAVVESRPYKWESSTFTDVCTVCGYTAGYSNANAIY